MRDHPAEQAATVIHTIGYEKTNLEDYIARLKQADVDVLIDVRDRPLSRKPGFSKKSLQAAVEEAGMAYQHVQALGDPKPGREAARSGDMRLFLEIFTAHMAGAAAQDAAQDLSEFIVGKRICLTCFERDHATCHRSIVAQHLSERVGAEVVHLSVY